jgi:hypothetical protein
LYAATMLCFQIPLLTDLPGQRSTVSTGVRGTYVGWEVPWLLNMSQPIFQGIFSLFAFRKSRSSRLSGIAGWRISAKAVAVNAQNEQTLTSSLFILGIPG